jgi:hypothetical protein
MVATNLIFLDISPHPGDTLTLRDVINGTIRKVTVKEVYGKEIEANDGEWVNGNLVYSKRQAQFLTFINDDNEYEYEGKT